MSAHYYVQLITALGVLAGVLYVVQRFGKAMYSKRFQGEIKVVDRTVVDANVSFVIVSVRGVEYLVGIGGREIQVFEEMMPQ